MVVILLRFLMPQVVGFAASIVLSYVAKPRALLHQMSGVLGAATAAWFISYRTWGGTELLSAVFILAFVAAHAVFGAVLQLVLSWWREEIAWTRRAS